MEITSVDIHLANGENPKLKAYVTVVVDNAIAIHDIKVIDGKEGLFIAMPNRLLPDGKRKDIVHPISTEIRTLFQKTILDEYENEKARSSSSETEEEEE